MIAKYTTELQKFLKTRTKSEPWLHCAIYRKDKSSSYYAIYVWDTREVLESGILNIPNWVIFKKCENAIDNRQELKCNSESCKFINGKFYAKSIGIESHGYNDVAGELHIRRYNEDIESILIQSYEIGLTVADKHGPMPRVKICPAKGKDYLHFAISTGGFYDNPDIKRCFYVLYVWDTRKVIECGYVDVMFIDNLLDTDKPANDMKLPLDFTGIEVLKLDNNLVFDPKSPVKVNRDDMFTGKDLTKCTAALLSSMCIAWNNEHHRHLPFNRWMQLRGYTVQFDNDGKPLPPALYTGESKEILEHNLSIIQNKRRN